MPFLQQLYLVTNNVFANNLIPRKISYFVAKKNPILLREIIFIMQEEFPVI